MPEQQVEGGGHSQTQQKDLVTNPTYLNKCFLIIAMCDNNLTFH